MDLQHSNIRVSHLVPPAMQSSTTPSVPIIAIAVIGIVGTSFLLVSYYVFVIKCCLSCHRVDDVLSRFSLSRRHRNHDHPNLFSSASPAPESRGLDEAAIRSIPILNFKNRGGANPSRDFGFCECAVCLNEFQEDEKLRFIPQCGHVFHIDCIDIWLHNNANCPLCRTSVSGAAHLALFDLNEQRVSASSSSNAVIRSEEDYVVIELGEPSRNLLDHGGQAHTPRKTTTTTKKYKKKKMMMFHQTSMGDEVIGARREAEERVQPIRRSFSMDSAGDMQLFVAVQQIMQQKREFFSFGNGRDRVSRSAVQPLCLEEEQHHEEEEEEEA